MNSELNKPIGKVESMGEQPKPVSVESAPEKRSCCVPPLDTILSKIEPIDWKPYQTIGRGGETKSPSEKIYILRSIEQTLAAADKIGIPFANHFGTIYFYIRTHYKEVSELELKKLLIEAAIRCGVPPDVAVFQFFVDKVFKQFLINTARHNSDVAEPDTAYINLRNGTLFFDKSGHRLEMKITRNGMIGTNGTIIWNNILTMKCSPRFTMIPITTSLMTSPTTPTMMAAITILLMIQITIHPMTAFPTTSSMMNPITTFLTTSSPSAIPPTMTVLAMTTLTMAPSTMIPVKTFLFDDNVECLENVA